MCGMTNGGKDKDLEDNNTGIDNVWGVCRLSILCNCNKYVHNKYIRLIWNIDDDDPT